MGGFQRRQHLLGPGEFPDHQLGRRHRGHPVEHVHRHEQRDQPAAGPQRRVPAKHRRAGRARTAGDDPDLAARFTPVAVELAAAESKITEELLAAQGEPQDIGGYYRPDPVLADKAMRPSASV